MVKIDPKLAARRRAELAAAEKAGEPEIKTESATSEVSLADIIDPKYAPRSWLGLFGNSEVKSELKYTVGLLNEENGLIPNPHRMYTPFNDIAPANVRVIIFHRGPTRDITPDGKVNSLGYAFGRCSPDEELKALAEGALHLRSTALGKTISEDVFDYTLAEWAMQGVLLLNVNMFVYANNQKTPEDIWLGFYRYVIEEIVKEKKSGKLIILLFESPKIATINLSGASPLIGTTFALKRGKPEEVARVLERTNRLLEASGGTRIAW